MSVELLCLMGLLIPLLGTTAGAAISFFMRKEMNHVFQKALLGFASGVMIAASVWSLLIPSLEMSEGGGGIAWLPAAGGFLLGIFFLLVFDSVVPHQHIDEDKPEGPVSHLGKSTMLVFAVTLHNIPEGMAVGVVFAGLLSGQSAITAAGALALSLGIALQNIPEGAIISAPLRSAGVSRGRSFFYGFLTGAVEPIGAGLTIALTAWITSALPWLLAFAAGAVIYVVIEELIPETQAGKHSNAGVIGCAFGFVLMMILDIALS